jgi:hypothetical protein
MIDVLVCTIESGRECTLQMGISFSSPMNNPDMDCSHLK